MDFNDTYDVVVAGGGNAALCAAITAARAGARVIVVEGAPAFYRGGNTRHTRNLRLSHDGSAPTMTGPYAEDEFLGDLYRVTGGKTDAALAKLTVARSAELLGWLDEQGVRFQPPLGGTLSLGKTNAFFLGGGRGALNALYRRAEALGVTCVYDAPVTALNIVDGFFISAVVKHGGKMVPIRGRTLIAAAGGFEANIEWLKEYWGAAADNFLIRGTPYNTGTVLRMLLDSGVAAVGDPTQCHAVAIDARAPEVRRRHRHPPRQRHLRHCRQRASAALLRRGRGRLAEALRHLGPPDRAAGRSDRLFDRRCQIHPPVHAVDLSGDRGGNDRRAGDEANLDPAALEKTVNDFNAAVQPGTFDHTALDDCVTSGLAIAKSHWARKLDTPPYYGYPLRPGITFTYLGVRVNEESRILLKDGKPSGNMFAAGEIMAGNVLGQGYLAGIGMTIGAVFGRLAGQGAASHVRN